MKNLRTSARVTVVLGALSIAALIIAHLALTDIYHGEGDQTAEWRALQAAAVTILGFQVVALVTVGRLMRRL